MVNRRENRAEDGGRTGQKTAGFRGRRRQRRQESSSGREFWEGVRRRRLLLEDSGDAKAGRSGRVAMRRDGGWEREE
ncbi:unnamed protein product [Linum trigynum]|uniref:Uncharacterized protein n=1 Tax=Linum trigynum TaxID=586398 RepID=A0AAV2FGC5_9ROSI